MGLGRAHTVEVLVVTAADGEPEALRAVNDGAEGPWMKRHLQDPTRTYDVRTYRREDGRSFEVALVHALAEARPDAFLPDLARSLNNLGNMLSDLGRREDALAATDEAVSIRRALAAAVV